MLLKALVVAMAMVMASATLASAARPTTTTIEETRARAGGRQALVSVRNAKDKPVTKGVVVGKLFLRHRGKWVLSSKQRTKSFGEEYFAFFFRGIPRTGRCKLVTRYRGTKRFERSRDVVRSPCGARDWAAS